MAPNTPACAHRSVRQKQGMVWAILTTPRLAMLFMGGCLFLLTMMGLAIWSEHGYVEVWRMQRDVDRLVRNIHQIEQENNGLRRNIERLQHDMGYIEKIAREELGLVRPGELVFEFIE